MNQLEKVILKVSGKDGSAKMKFILFIVAIVLFVLGSGAPEAGGGIINGGSIFKF